MSKPFSNKKDFPVLHQLGKKFTRLGKAMQRNDYSIAELSSLAFDCGLTLEFRITPQNKRLTHE